MQENHIIIIIIIVVIIINRNNNFRCSIIYNNTKPMKKRKNPVCAGLWSKLASLQNALPCGRSEREDWKSTKAWFHWRRQCVEGNGCAHIQLMALVDPHRKIPAVWSISYFHDHSDVVGDGKIWRLWVLLIRWDYVQVGNTVKKDMDRLEAFYQGLTTWARWVEMNVDPSKTKVIFQGISPTHYE